jgi:hypothetical protein
MAHATFIEDETGDVVDAEYYCSDSCAQESPYYSGWSGCHELCGEPEFCQSCNEQLDVISD